MTRDVQDQIEDFQRTVWAYYDVHGRRELPWRLTDDPYKIWVSELMLQQTQVNRVIPKYESFLKRFPDVETLAAASLGDVLIEWQGLGYNRRAKYLWEGCKLLTKKWVIKPQYAKGSSENFPNTFEDLTALPGIGPNTAGAILAYAYNREVVFIETNIRTVFIHHFFNDQTAVPDKTIRELVEATLPKNTTKNTKRRGGGVRNKALPSPDEFSFRDWYWALMDYGTHIKQTHGNKSRASKSYNKQSKFEGSRRQIRGAVIRQLSRQPTGYVTLREKITDDRLDEVLAELITEGMIARETSNKTAVSYRLS